MTCQNQAYQSSFDLFAEPNAVFSDLAVSEPAGPEQAEAADHPGLPAGEKTEGYAVYVFTRPEARRGAERCYYIVYQPSLWDSFTVQRQWGMAGSLKQQFYTEHFRSPRPALARIRRLIEHRLRHGYRLSYAA